MCQTPQIPPPVILIYHQNNIPKGHIIYPTPITYSNKEIPTGSYSEKHYKNPVDDLRKKPTE